MLKKVLLCGYFGYGNLGDEAILNSAISLLSKYKITPYVMFNPKGDFSSQAALGARYCNRFSVRAVKDSLSECDALIFSGGNLFQNTTSNRSLLYYTAIAALAQKAGKPIYMISSGLGDIRGKLEQTHVRRIMSGFSFAGLRTELDIREGNSIFSCPTAKMPDLFFSEPPLFERKSDYFAIIPRKRSSALLNEARRLKSMGLRAVVIPFFIDEDAQTASFYGGELGCEVFFSQNPGEIKKRLGTSRLVITERLHGAIFSLLSSTPALLVSNATKCKRFALETEKRAKKLNTPSPIIKKEALASFDSLGSSSDFFALCSSFKKELSDSFDMAFG